MDKIKILVADDEPHIIRVIRDKLNNSGYQVIVAVDGKEAMEKALVENPRLIILDVMMPYFDGFEVCRYLREQDATREIPILMLTAKGQESDETAGLCSGANQYLTKPFSPRKLVECIQELLPN